MQNRRNILGLIGLSPLATLPAKELSAQSDFDADAVDDPGHITPAGGTIVIDYDPWKYPAA